MFVKVTSSGSRRYLQLVEAYRDEHGKPKQRTVATLGRLDQLDGQLDQVIAGLARATGKPIAVNAPPAIVFECARAFGDVWALTELWHELGFDQLQRVFRRTRHEIDVEALLRIMVFNRLCDPESKVGVLRWLETVTLPGLALKAVSHHQLLRAMDGYKGGPVVRAALQLVPILFQRPAFFMPIPRRSLRTMPVLATGGGWPSSRPQVQQHAGHGQVT